MYFVVNNISQVPEEMLEKGFMENKSNRYKEWLAGNSVWQVNSDWQGWNID